MRPAGSDQQPWQPRRDTPSRPAARSCWELTAATVPEPAAYAAYTTHFPLSASYRYRHQLQVKQLAQGVGGEAVATLCFAPPAGSRAPYFASVLCPRSPGALQAPKVQLPRSETPPLLRLGAPRSSRFPRLLLLRFSSCSDCTLPPILGCLDCALSRRTELSRLCVVRQL